MSGYKTFDNVVNKGVSFLLNQVDSLSSAYSQAMVAYALALSGEDKADQLIDNLFSVADKKGCLFNIM